MRRNPALLLLLGGGLIALMIAAAGPLMSQTEHPRYTVLQTDGSVELRTYPPMVTATVTLGGSRQSAVQSGFQALAGYIFGGNDGGRKIAMTAPVMERRSSTETGAQDWTIRFVMPREWSFDDLPQPKDKRIRLETMPGTTFAVIRFSGFWRDALLKKKTEELQSAMAREGWKGAGPPIYAFYNPPWTLPFLRRNEVMIEVDRH